MIGDVLEYIFKSLHDLVVRLRIDHRVSHGGMEDGGPLTR
jgi:hypothetical protein